MSGVRKGGWHLLEGERGQGGGWPWHTGTVMLHHCCTNEGSRVRPYIHRHHLKTRRVPYCHAG